MEIGVVLPSGVPGVDGRTVVEWARRTDAGPFSSIAVADRLAYPNLDLMMTLAAAAAVTSRVRLVANVLLAGWRQPPLVAKEIATLAALAPGRVSIGVGVGGRPADYELVGLPWDQRGRLVDECLGAVFRIKDAGAPDQDLGPQLPDDVEILIGGASPPALRRLVRYGHGYMSGGLKPGIFAFEAMASLQAWQAAGRPGRPRIVAGTWYASSEDPDDRASASLAHYLQQGGPPPPVNAGIARGRDGVTECVRSFREQGADEVILFPLVDDVGELDWLADVVATMPEFPRGEPTPRPFPGTAGAGEPDGRGAAA